MSLSRNKANLLLLLAAAIWGFAFVAQRVGMRHVGPFTFTGIRFAIGALTLLPILLFWCPGQERIAAAKGRPVSSALAIKGGILAGLLLFGGITFQQFGLLYTTAGRLHHRVVCNFCARFWSLAWLQSAPIGMDRSCFSCWWLVFAECHWFDEHWTG